MACDVASESNGRNAGKPEKLFCEAFGFTSEGIRDGLSETAHLATSRYCPYPATLTPSSLPIANVTPAARAPMPTMRKPL